MSNVLALLVAAAAASAPVALPRTMSTTALPPVGVSVVVARGVPPSLVSHILEEADAIWRPALRFAWQQDARLPAAVRVVIENAISASGEAETPLGWVVFEGSIPQPEIHVSFANAYALLRDSREIVGSMQLMPPLQRDTLLGYAMGRALAHELGHYLLASKAHTPHGLMQARRTAAELFARDRSHFQIDEAVMVAIAARAGLPLYADMSPRPPARQGASAAHDGRSR
jgi:hypothetical protein